MREIKETFGEAIISPGGRYEAILVNITSSNGITERSIYVTERRTMLWKKILGMGKLEIKLGDFVQRIPADDGHGFIEAYTQPENLRFNGADRLEVDINYILKGNIIRRCTREFRLDN